MRTTIIISFLVFFFSLQAAVKTSLDIISSGGFKELYGKKVALVINHTSVDSNGKHIIDLMLDKKISVVRIFTPEHGLTGTLEGSITDSLYKGIQVISLYGSNRKPKPEQITDADIIVFDIQDAGARYYTYLATLVYILEAAKTAGKPVIVLDRPNPAGGEIVSGFVPPDELTGKFTSIFPIPTRHGMTIGEIAKLFNDHFGIKADLKVIKMEGWKRSMLWKDTGLKWIPPSPNLKTPESAVIYSAIGWIETANISVGRGTDSPFFIYGSPFIDGEKLKKALSDTSLRGVSIESASFTPDDKNHKYYGKLCNGIKFNINDLKEFSPELSGLYLLTILQKLYPDQLKFSGDFDLSIGARGIIEKIKSGATALDIYKEMETSSDKFKDIRKKFLLY
ncbi:MAG TPA: DUF1343 domain-containing protein [bacterium]|nr:DUF1343 domain-containing protein [bacterium]